MQDFNKNKLRTRPENLPQFLEKIMHFFFFLIGPRMEFYLINRCDYKASKQHGVSVLDMNFDSLNVNHYVKIFSKCELIGYYLSVSVMRGFDCYRYRSVVLNLL